MTTMNGQPYAAGKFAHSLRVRLWREHLNDARPVFCLGTTSAFGAAAGGQVVEALDERSPLEGIGANGKPLAERTEAEEWALKRGAVVGRPRGDMDTSHHGAGPVGATTPTFAAQIQILVSARSITKRALLCRL